MNTYCYFNSGDLACLAADWLFVGVMIMVVAGMVVELVRRLK